MEYDLTDSSYLVDLNEFPEAMDVVSIEEILQRSKFTVYHADARDNLTRSRIDHFNAVCTMLHYAGVQEYDIVKANINTDTDFDLVEYISLKAGGSFVPPVVFMGSRYIGGYKEIYELYHSHELQRMIHGDNPTSKVEQDIPEILPLNDDKPQLGTISTALEVVETVVDYLNPFSWIRFYKGPSNSYPPLLSVDVINTNWYGRNQRRIYRFYSTDFQRVHPNGIDVRATYKYDDISKLQMPNSKLLIINYTSGGSPDWIGASEKDISSIKNLLQQQLPSISLEKWDNMNFDTF